MFFAAHPQKIEEETETAERERALVRLVSTPDRRVSERDALDGVVELRRKDGHRMRAVTVDLGEGGWRVLTMTPLLLGELVCIEVDGLVIEARVRHVAGQGTLYRIGLEAQ